MSVKEKVGGTVPSLNKIFSHQMAYFTCGLVVFIFAATLGWEKLHYGFNFIDEGYHMTESWRLTAGDHFLKDKVTGALRHYTLINSLIFRVCPDITLLGFRKLQYFLTIFSLILLSVALYRFDKKYWYQPLIFSLFAFTGLDPIGMISNMYYQTYPHLFITFHIAFFLIALYSKQAIIRKFLFIISGLCLWLISLSLLHLSVIVVSPILLFIFSRKLKSNSFSFSFHDLCYALGPFVICWTAFIAIYNTSYLSNLMFSIDTILSISTYSPNTLININWEAIKHICISMIVLLVFFLCIKKFCISISIVCLTVLSFSIYFIIDTSFFGLLTPYYNGWFGCPMWLNSFLIAFTILFWAYIISKHFFKREYTRGEILAVILLTPFSVMALTMSIFSGLGVLSVLQCSIPAVAAIAVTIIYVGKIHKQTYAIKLFILILFCAPFYIATGWADWSFSFFDVSPRQANVTIEEGFGRGIKTNRVYYGLYGWIRSTSEKYTDKDDFIISYVVSPMVHMIAKRRPALDDTFISFGDVPMGYYDKSISKMKERNRYPKLAFVFESMPAFAPISLKDGKYGWFGKQFVFSPQSHDPISRYVLDNMKLKERYQLYEGIVVRCFVDDTTNN